MTSRRIAAILLAGAAPGAIAPAHASRILFSTATDAAGRPVPAGTVPAGQPVETKGGTLQVMLDSGAIVSFVGPARFAVDSDGRMAVASGSTTIVSFGMATPVGLPGGASASVTGAGSFNVGSGGINGMALSGAIALTSGGQTRDFGPGQSYNAAAGAGPGLIFAAAPQAVPSATGDAPAGGTIATQAPAPQQNPAVPALTPGTPAEVASALRTALANGNRPGGGVDGGFASTLLAFAGQAGSGANRGTGAIAGGSTNAGAGSTATGSTPSSPVDPNAGAAPATGIGTPSTAVNPGGASAGEATASSPGAGTNINTGASVGTDGGSSGGSAPVSGTNTGTGSGSGTATGSSPGAGPASGTATAASVPVASFGRTAAGIEIGHDPGLAPVAYDAAGNPSDFGLYGKTLTATVAESKSGAGWTIGRYSGGDFQRGTGASATTVALGAGEGLHYAVLAPLTQPLTAGLATYRVAAFTQPTAADGRAIAGALFDATLGIAFGTVPRIGLEGTLSYGDAAGASSYSFATAGGAAAPSQTGAYYFGSGTNQQVYAHAPLSGSGSACASIGACRLDLVGILGGEGGALFGSTYSVIDTGTSKATLIGAAMLTRTGYDAGNTIGSPSNAGTGAAGSGVEVTSANVSGLAQGNLPSSASGGDRVTRLKLAPALRYALFDANGNPTQTGNVNKASGAKLLEVRSGTGWTLGRFGDGLIGDDSTNARLGPNQGVSVFIGTPTTNLPTSGLAFYSVTDQTAPTFYDGQTAPGGSFAANLGIAFGATAASTAYGYDGTLTVTELGATKAYSFATGGGANAPGLTNGAIADGNFYVDGRAAVSTAGELCGTGANCLLYLRGSTLGAGASLFGATYELYNVSEGKGKVNGAAIFGKTSGSGAAATGATGGGAPTYVIAYAGKPQGIDTRTGVTASFVDNALASYYASYQENLAVGSNSALTGYRDALVNVGRWAGGTTTGAYYGTSGTIAYPANGGLAYAIGTQATNLPASGTLQYSLLGYAAPTFTDGGTAPGTVTSAAMGVTFGATSRVGLEFAIAMPGDGAYSFATAGGAANPGLSAIAITPANRYAPVTRFATSGATGVTGVGGRACPDAASCTVSIQGFFAGDRVQRAGLVYALVGGSTLAANTIHGALAFGSDGMDVPAIPAAPQPESTGSIAAAFTGSGGRALNIVKDGQTRLARLTANLNVNFDAGGRLSDYQATAVNYATRGTAVTGEAYGTANVQIGRWNGGTTTGMATNALDAGFKGFHYALINPAIALPAAGVARFTLAGATKPTYGDGFTEEGSFTGTMAIALDTAKRVGLDLAVAMSDRTYAVQTAGGAAQPAKSAATLTNAGQFANLSVALTGSSGHACPDSNCVFTAQGGLAASGTEFAFAYAIGSSTSTFNNYVVGAAAFASSGFATPVTLDTRSTPTNAAFANGNYTMVSSAATPFRFNSGQTFGSQHEQTGGVDTIGSNGAYEVGARSFAESGGTATAFMGWGRWSGGRTGGSGTDYTGGRGFHYVTGTPTTIFPTSGTVSYQLVGATAPTVADGAHQPGTLTSGAMTIAFGGTNRVGLDLAFTMPNDASYTIATAGGAANPAASGLTIGGGQAYFSGTATASAVPVGATSVGCGSGACPAAQINGMLFGPSAAGAGIIYTLGNAASQIAGAAAFARN